MNTKEKSFALKAAIITMSFVQMGINGIAPILDEIGKTFPTASAASIQFLMTFPSIFMVICTLLSAVLANKIPQKRLAVFGLSLVTGAGVLACFFHGSLQILFVWAALLGIGIGMVSPIAPALVTGRFEGRQRQAMLGIQNSSANIGSMLMTLFGGFLAAAGWKYGYLVYLIAIPGIIFAVIGISENKQSVMVGEVGEKAAWKITIKKEMAIGFAFLLLFSSIPSNLAMLIGEKGIGGTALAGTMSTIFLLGGTIAGFAFGMLVGKLKNMIIPVGVLLLALGTCLISFASGSFMLAIGCLISGASISFVMPSCMAATAKMKGYETLASALILGCSNIGVFVAPVLTTLTAVITGSDSTVYRFQTLALLAFVLSMVTFFIRQRKVADL